MTRHCDQTRLVLFVPRKRLKRESQLFQMSEQSVFALATVVISGVFSLAVAWATLHFGSKTQDRAFRRELAKIQVETTRNFYRDVLAYFTLTAKHKCPVETSANIKALLPLTATSEIQTLFWKTNATLENYLKELPMTSAEPTHYEDMEIPPSDEAIESAIEHTSTAETLRKQYEKEFIELGSLMAKHLNELQKSTS